MAEQGYILTPAEGALLAKTVKAVRSIRGDGVANSEDGIFIRQRKPARRPSAGAYPIEIVTVVSDAGEYLVCRPYGINEDEEGNIDDSFNLKVAKPWDLRSYPFNGLTLPNKDGTMLTYAYSMSNFQQRTVSDDDGDEIQVVVPAYVPEQVVDGVRYTGSQIVIRKLREGTSVTATDGEIIEHEDANHAGRAWAESNE